MEKKEFRKKLLSLVLPITFQQLMLAVVSASDALMVGAIGQDLLSAVSLASQVTFVYNLFLAALTIGTSMFAAQYWGKRDYASVEKILGIVLRISLAVSLLFFLGATFLPGLLMRIFTTDPVLIRHGVRYLRIVGITYLLCGVSQIYLCIMKNSGLATRSMVIGSAAAALNLVLNAVLIYGLFGAPRMEAAGAALATAISRAAELLWVLYEHGKKGRIKMRLSYLRHPDAVLKKDFWHYTLPVLGNELVWGGGFTMYSVIMGHLGSDAVAANSIANIVKNLIASLALGIGNGGSILVGNELGAGRLEQARRYGGAVPDLSDQRNCIRDRPSFGQPLGSGCHGSYPGGGRIPEMDAGHVQLLYGREIRQRYDHCRYFLRRRRFQVWISVRCGDALVLYGSGGISDGVRVEVPGTFGVFCNQSG